MGTCCNERYSPLDQVDTSNVAQLKGVWMTHLNGSALAAKYSAESQPVVYKGVIYITTGNNDVFAVGVASGKILWNYSSGISQKISTICCGWLNRGVALGDGRVYFGQLDGSVVALDQKTGKQIWKKQLVKWQLGQTITAAPIYIDGKIYIGSRRGRVRRPIVPRGAGRRDGQAGVALVHDAGAGRAWWRHLAGRLEGIPARRRDDLAGAGGRREARTAVLLDRQRRLGLVRRRAAGQEPLRSLDRCARPQTGKLKWYFQQVHHDIWDFDSASPVVLFDAGGTHGIAQASKTGWLYMLDRATGKPLYGIPEKPVPQDAEQKTWPTQPIPDNGAFTPHGRPPAADVQRIRKQAVGPLEKVPVVIAKEPFTPVPVGKMLIYGNGPQGGVNWQPISYNAKTQMFYVCSVRLVGRLRGGADAVRAARRERTPARAAPPASRGPKAAGTFTAIDATSGKVVWQKTFPEPCYSGTATTAGNLVFVGRNGGELQAYNATER